MIFFQNVKLVQFLNFKFSLFSILYFTTCILFEIDGMVVIADSIFLFLSFFLIGLFGYFTNDVSDIKTDELIGKPNIASRFSPLLRFFISFFLAASGITVFFFIGQQVLPYVLLEVFLLLMYAFPPLRLKERGWIAIITDALYAYALPFLIIIKFLDNEADIPFYFDVFYFSFGLTLGIKNIIRHQLEDLDNDLISGTKTFAIKNSEISNRLEKCFTIFSTIVWCLGWTCYLIFVKIHILVLMILLTTAVVLLFKLWLKYNFKLNTIFNSLPETDIVYYGLSSLLLFVLITLKFDYFFLLVFIFLPFWFKKTHEVFFNKIYRWIYKWSSFIVNYSLYYGFLVFGIDLKEKRNQRVVKVDFASKNTHKNITLNVTDVHGLWIGKVLSSIELLTIKSFLHNGYTFHLWLYEELETSLPEGCIVEDASSIMPRNTVFTYRYASQYGIGKGSYAGFSDIFRYKLLYDRGGWWVDMDVTCLKPFDVEGPYFFRKHHELPLVGNVMKAPKGSPVMWNCYERALKEVDTFNRDWHKPIQILVEEVMNAGLSQSIYDEFGNTDEWHILEEFLLKEKPLPEHWFFIHWCNEAWKYSALSKYGIILNSSLGVLLDQHNINHEGSNYIRDRILIRKHYLIKLAQSL